jgi:predicted phosphoribosyltransferase
MTSSFADRPDAGRYLAGKLAHYAGRANTVVLALPRGGVPVGAEIASALDLPLDVFVVRKLGAPMHEELAVGAIASGGIRFLNEALINRLGISARMIDSITDEERREMERREQLYRAQRPPIQVQGKTVILVDDGLATGASMRAAVQALRHLHPARIVVAVPVGAADTCREFEAEVDEVICSKTPEDFGAVGMWYDDFTQISDQEVAELLNHNAHQRRVRQVLQSRPDLHHEILARHQGF